MNAKWDSRYTAIYAAEFVRRCAEQQHPRGYGLEDGGIIIDSQEARALADWELELREEADKQ